MSIVAATKNGNEKPSSSIAFGNRGVEIRSMEDLFRFAKVVSESGLAPKGMESPQAILVAVELGMELGLPPLASLQNIAVINGRPSVWGDAMLAICRGSGVFDEEAFEETISGDKDQMEACCTVRRKPGKITSRKFSAMDAKRAGLWGKSGPWTQYPQRMLQMRARSFALRDAFSDVLKGVYSAEEVRDLPTVSVEVVASETPKSLEDLSRKMEAHQATRELIKDDGEIVDDDTPKPAREEFALAQE